MVTTARADRQELIVEVLQDAFSDLMKADPHAFRVLYDRWAKPLLDWIRA